MRGDARLVLANTAPYLGTRRLITLCLAGIVLGLLLTWLLPGPDIWNTTPGIWLTGFCLGPLFPTAIALMPQFAPVRLLPSAIGFLACLAGAGAALFPAAAGDIMQRLGFWFLPPFALVLTVAMLGVWLMLRAVPTEQMRKKG
jgi:MFS family permease